MRRRRANPERAYFVKDGYSKHMEEFGSLRTAIKYAMRVGDFISADDVIKHIYVERDERYIPLAQASKSAAKVVAEYANRNPMRRRKNPSHVRSILGGRDRADAKRKMAIKNLSRATPPLSEYRLSQLRLESRLPKNLRRKFPKHLRKYSKWVKELERWDGVREKTRFNPKRRGQKARAFTKQRRDLTKELRQAESEAGRGVGTRGVWQKSYIRGNYRRWQRNEKRIRRGNPGHPSYAQHLMRLGLHHGDPIIELASVWASGADAGTRLIKQALVSAEHWRESKDKRLRQAMTSVINKLGDFLRHAEQREDRRAPRSTRTIHPAWRTNPRRSRRR